MPKTVAILVFDDVEVLDFAGPFEVFAVTWKAKDEPAFKVLTVAPAAGVVRARNGLKVVPDHAIADCPAAEILVIPGGFGTRALIGNDVLIKWIQERSASSELTMSVCTGALLLAKAGLLDGLRATTHHDALDLLRSLAPKATIDPASRFHDNGRILTAAGISAGIDCSLHVVGRVLGEAIAGETAAHMEYERRR
jgi:transcriptional regulator GlxA family with amidase domain